MKTTIKRMMYAFIFGVMLASCGGGGSAPKLASNDLLGDLPNLVYQRAYNDSILEAEQEAAEAKLDPSNKGDWEKAVKIDKEFDAKEDELDAKLEADIEALKATLIGKDIPFEVEEGVGFEVSSAKISDVDSGGAQVEFAATITDAKAFSLAKYGAFDFTYQLLDKDGNQIGNDGGSRLKDMSGNDNGATGTGTVSLSFGNKNSTKQFVNFAKIRFVKE